VWDWLQLHAIERLLVTERKESVAEILCRLLDIPILDIDIADAAALRDSLRAAQASVRTFVR